MKEKEYKLIKKSIKGDKKACEKLIKKHYEQIYRTAYLYVHNKEDALDIVQEATYQALISIHTLKHPEYFMTWFTKIVIRCSGQVLSKRKNIVSLTDGILLKLDSDIGVINDDSLYLIDAIGKLKENYRTVIVLFYYYDYSIKKIGQIMEVPEGTVKTYLSRGKSALKKDFEKERNYG
ncbi:sigma-70 family RNA polymerase sigma factor [Clostridium sp. D2Q-11]|uniref:Sigma-70 family RNA polymerase sigma factor n=1 Tax=Anaeromonas frigoriresistens TaxID=2683708 RepID=A0A942UUM1_9FIRM|nr:sigma-70 family RNA polymerase sigma factor [Anaeromonas frigoriresistens]MBS4537146.1 sigma-70 family RNA polymerase sigma factor [Anaeromonas frigoriresistens]